MATATSFAPAAHRAQRVPMRVVLSGETRPLTASFNGKPVPASEILAQAGIPVRPGMGLRIGGYAFDLEDDVRPALRAHVAQFASTGGLPGGTATLDGTEAEATFEEITVASPLTALVSETIKAG